MDVSIIIVNYKTCSLVEACIKSIYKHSSGVSYEVIVVDNASNDGSVTYLKQKFPNVIFIENEYNWGFGGANNIGLEKAKGDYFFLLNSDTIVLDNIVLYLFEACKNLQREEAIGALGLLLLDRNRNWNYKNSDGRFPTLKSFLEDVVYYYFRYSKNQESHLQYEKDKFMDVDYIVGADLFIPRKVIDEIGAFDTNFFMYWEEVDLQKRMSDHGYKRRILFGGKLVHLEGMSTQKNFTLLKKKMYHTSLCYYFSKHRPYIELIVLKILLLISSLRSLTKEKFSDLNKYWKSVLSCKIIYLFCSLFLISSYTHAKMSSEEDISIVPSYVNCGNELNLRNTEASCVQLANGTLFCAYTKFWGMDDDEVADIAGSYSYDGGRTSLFSISEDGGEIFSIPYKSNSKSSNAPMKIVACGDILFAIHNPTEGAIRNKLCISKSLVYGNTWQEIYVIEESGNVMDSWVYSSALMLNGDRLLITHWELLDGSGKISLKYKVIPLTLLVSDWNSESTKISFQNTSIF